MTEDGDQDYASIDLAVTFFASIMMMFAFTSFTFSPQRPTAPKPTLGQAEATVQAVPPAWSAAAPRTHYAWFAEGELVVLDMTALAAAVIDPSTIWPDSASLRLPFPVESPTPAGFRLDMSFVPAEFPVAWVRQRLRPEPGAPCPATPNALLTVWLDSRAPDFEALLTWAEVCGLRLRIEALQPSDSGRLTPRLGLHPDLFSRATIFR